MALSPSCNVVLAIVMVRIISGFGLVASLFLVFFHFCCEKTDQSDKGAVNKYFYCCGLHDVGLNSK